MIMIGLFLLDIARKTQFPGHKNDREKRFEAPDSDRYQKSTTKR